MRGTGTVCVGGRGWRGGGANIGVWWLGSAPGAPSRGMPTCRPRGAGSAGTAGGSAATCSSIVASALRRLADAASAPHNVHPWSGPTRSASRSWLLRHHLGIGRLLAQVRGRRRERRRERRAALPHRRHRRRGSCWRPSRRHAASPPPPPPGELRTRPGHTTLHRGAPFSVTCQTTADCGHH